VLTLHHGDVSIIDTADLFGMESGLRGPLIQYRSSLERERPLAIDSGIMVVHRRAGNISTYGDIFT